VAEDQTDAGDDELAMDTAQIAAMIPDWVCGRCLEEISEAKIVDQ
jgi:hypothetical protein